MPSPLEVYRRLEPERSSYEFRAEKCAALTIPYLFPPNGTTAARDFPTPYQSNAANGVNTMASAISLSLLPPNMPFFRYELDGRLENELREIQNAYESAGRPERIYDEVQSGLSLWERAVVKEIERKNYRVGYHEASRLLLVTGNALMEHLPEGGLRVHGLRSYVICRNPDGTVAEIVLHELKAADQLTEQEADAVKAVDWAWPNLIADKNAKVAIVTRVCFKGDRYEMVQQVGGEVLEDEAVEGAAGDCQFWPLRFSRVSGEHYGRGYVEEYYGDIGSLDTTQQGITEIIALMCKVLFMVDPASGVNPKSLSTAPNGAFRSGRADAVTTIQVQKIQELMAAMQFHERLAAQVNRAFAVPEVRNAERVTAEEIRFLQTQLERSLGGSFPLLALDLQLPTVRQITKRLQARKILPALPREGVEPVVVTGVQALGRSTDSARLDELAAAATAALGPQVVAQHMDASGWLTRKAAALGMDPAGLIRTNAQIQAMQEAANRAAMQAEATKAMIPAAGRVLAKAVPEGAGGVPQAA